MPINVGFHYKLVCDLLSKNNGVSLSPEEYERYGYTASLEMFDDFCGIKTTPRIAYGRNRLTDLRLKPFRRRVELSFSNELLTIPPDARNITAIYTKIGNIPVKPIDEDRMANIMLNPLANPNDSDIYYLEETDKLRLLGNDSLDVIVHYLERPKPIKYAYTLGTGGRAVYDDDESEHYAWDISETEELTNRILAKIGLSMRDVLQIQSSQNNKNQE